MQAEPIPSGRLSSARRVAGPASAAALAALTVTGVLLTWRYRPAAGGPEDLLPESSRWSRRLVGAHEASMLAAGLALVVWGALTVADRSVRGRRAGTAVAATVLALALVGVTAHAWQRVRWEQLGLWAVTVGEDIRGLWYAGFSEEVRFAFVGGAEVAPGDLAPWVVVHLLAPIGALVAVTIGWRSTEPRRSHGPRRSIVPPLTDDR